MCSVISSSSFYFQLQANLSGCANFAEDMQSQHEYDQAHSCFMIRSVWKWGGSACSCFVLWSSCGQTCCCDEWDSSWEIWRTSSAWKKFLFLSVSSQMWRTAWWDPTWVCTPTFRHPWEMTDILAKVQPCTWFCSFRRSQTQILECHTGSEILVFPWSVFLCGYCLFTQNESMLLCSGVN